MLHDAIITGYARALLAMAEAESAVSHVEEDLFRLRELLKTTPVLLEFLKDANIKREGRRQALSELLHGKVHALTLNLLLTLADTDHSGRVLPVIEEFSHQAAAARHTVTGEITTAVALDEGTLGRLTAELNRATGKNVRLLQRVDAGILGGAIIKVGEQVIDASLRHKLDQIQVKLAQ